jgi:hypothetical protein
MGPIKKRMRVIAETLAESKNAKTDPSNTVKDMVVASPAAEMMQVSNDHSNNNEVSNVVLIKDIQQTIHHAVTCIRHHQQKQEQQQQHQDVGKNKQNVVDAMSTINEIRSVLLKLKYWQTLILNDRTRMEKLLAQKQYHYRQQYRQLQALQYESQHLLLQIKQQRQYETPSFHSIVQQEKHENYDRMLVATSDTGDSDANKINCSVMSDEDDMKLDSHDDEDAENYDLVLQKIEQERKQLTAQLDTISRIVTSLDASVQQQQSLLNGLPDQLQVIERASKPLQKFFLTNHHQQLQQRSQQQDSAQTPPVASSTNDINHSNSNSADVACTMLLSSRLRTTDRSTRFLLARELPSPLYTLWLLLQDYIDQYESHVPKHKNWTNEGENPMTITVSKDPIAEVLLHISVQPPKARKSEQANSTEEPPNIRAMASANNSLVSNKRVTIHFRYYDTNGGYVTAFAKGCGSTLFQDALLEELFPGDSGKAVGHPGVDRASGHIVEGYPYYWCNVLAGLIPTEPVSTTEKAATNNVLDNERSQVLAQSTWAVIGELRRRIRANATCKYVVQTLLQKTELPCIPNLDRLSMGFQDISNIARIVKVSEVYDTERPDHLKVYHFSFQVENCILFGQAEINVARYPAVPPSWSLNRQHDGDGSTGKNNAVDDDDERPLYDRTVKDLEDRLNGSDLEKLVDTSQDDSYDWILGRQVQWLQREWSFVSTANLVTSQTRNHRGRDRIAIH